MRSGPVRFILLPGIFLCLWAGLRFLLPLCLPCLLGLGLALAAEPLVRPLSRRVPRALGAALGVSAAFLALAAGLLLLFALLLRGLRSLGSILPELEQTAAAGITLLEDRLLGLARQAPGTLGALLQQNVRALFSGSTALLAEGGKYILSLAGSLLTRIPGGFLTAGTALISGFMLSVRLPGLRLWCRRRLTALQPLLRTLGRIRRAVGGWLLAQAKLSCLSFVLLTLGFVILKIPYAPVWALGTALLDALPVLGTGTVLLPWSLVCFVQQDSPRALGLIGIYVAESLIRSGLEPRLLGRQLGLDPLVTLMALWAGYRLGGLMGMLLAPVLAVTVLQILPYSGKEPE